MRKTFFIFMPCCLWLLAGCAASHYSLGRQHLEEEHYNEALAEFELAKQEKPDDPELLRNMGIAYYRSLNLDAAIPPLLQAFVLDTTNGITLFYLGTAYEITQRPNLAMDIYRRYMNVHPSADIRSRIEGRLEKLIRKQMETEIREALENENTLSIHTIPDSSIAVLYFQNLGDNRDLDPIQKGLADMLITDLSKVRKLHVIERLRMQKLMEALNLGMTGLVDNQTVPRVGRLLGASLLVKGSFMDLSGETLRIDAGWIPVKAGDPIKITGQVDQLNHLFKMEKNLAFSLIDRMGIGLSQEERDAIEVIPTESLLAFMAYCNALDYEDRGMFEQSSEFYREALIYDPGFTQAGDKLKVSDNLSAGEIEIADLEKAFISGENAPVFGGSVRFEGIVPLPPAEKNGNAQ